MFSLLLSKSILVVRNSSVSVSQAFTNTALCGILCIMPNPGERLNISPLFYDALSGEFAPPSDPKKRLHTLGRLAYAGFTKGELAPANFSMLGVQPKYDPFQSIYRPSWAPSVETLVSGAFNRADRTYSLTCIQVTSSDDEMLVVRSTVNPGDNFTSFELVSPDGSSFNGPLELGEDLASAKNRITEGAQGFFNSVS